MAHGQGGGWAFRAFVVAIHMAHLALILCARACHQRRVGLPLGDMACGRLRILATQKPKMTRN